MKGKELIPFYKIQCDQFNIVSDCWLCGPPERGPNLEKFAGAFPAGFLGHIKDSFSYYWPNLRNQILHVCAGRVSKEDGMTLDISDKYKPDYLCNAEDMILTSGEKVPSDQFLFTLSDTPYNLDAAKKYFKTPMLNRSLVLRQMNRVTSIGGLIGILDQITTVSPPRNLQVVARIGVTSVPNLDMRYFTVLKKLSAFTGKEKDKGLDKMENYF